MSSSARNKSQFSFLHFIGVGGSGMSALAGFALSSGLKVQGSDRLDETNAPLQKLSKAGCRIVAQNGSGISPQLDAVIYSTAIEKNNPDLMRAEELGIAVLHRSELLAYFARGYTSIAVAGTSGKTTTTAMIFEMLRHIGAKPSVICGAEIKAISSNQTLGNYYRAPGGNILIYEADESDGSIAAYTPDIGLVLNASRDHKPLEEILHLFKGFLNNSKTALYNRDDPPLCSIAEASWQHFGIDHTLEYKRGEITQLFPTITCQLGNHQVTVRAAGTHSLQNYLAAVGACISAGFSLKACATALEQFAGVARRFDIYQAGASRVVIDDFAHNPAKIAAAITSARQLCPRPMMVIFQPHGYGPLRFMLKELAADFSELLDQRDTLVLLPVYDAGGSAVRSIQSADLLPLLSASLRKKTLTPPSKDSLLKQLRLSPPAEEVILSMGARDPDLAAFARDLAALFPR